MESPTYAPQRPGSGDTSEKSCDRKAGRSAVSHEGRLPAALGPRGASLGGHDICPQSGRYAFKSLTAQVHAAVCLWSTGCSSEPILTQFQPQRRWQNRRTVTREIARSPPHRFSGVLWRRCPVAGLAVDSNTARQQEEERGGRRDRKTEILRICLCRQSGQGLRSHGIYFLGVLVCPSFCDNREDF